MQDAEGAPAVHDGPAGGGGILRTFSRMRLSVRLAVFSALLAAAVTVVTFAALSVEIRQNTTRLLSDELNRNSRTLVSLQRDNRRQLVVSAALLGESPPLKSALETYRLEMQSGDEPSPVLTETVERELRRQGENLNGGTLLVTDERGKVFAEYTEGAASSMRGTDLSTLPAVRNALNPGLVTDAEEAYLSALEVGGGFYRVGVAPLILDGFTIGTIVFGQRVDSSAVSSLRRGFDGDVVVSAGDRIISSTLPAAPSRIAASDPGQTGQPLTLGNDEYLAAAIPLGSTQHGQALRITLLQPLSPVVRSLTAALWRPFLLYGGLGVLVAALGSSLLSQSLFRPLRRFIGFMRRGAERERVDEAFDAQDASQELRALNESFDQLMSSLERKRTELERRGSELASANTVLTEEIHERERVERALRESEAQLRQSQKLEAVGTLAGGIAHDFNNMLTVISGFTQMAMTQLGKEHPVVADLKQVSDAATSAAGLTHQLLAFSRKQVLQPRVLDLNDIVHGMEGMVDRLIGPTIELTTALSADLVRIKADPGQLEQVLLNLVVNARDAMPNGGFLVISTEYRRHAGQQGEAVLRVRDNGAGMPADVRDRVFEPFFTTKDVGKGTGLGLSTVYGIVTQSGGTISVTSAPGKGTTFTVTFPVISEALPAAVVAESDTELPRGVEIVLVVDDEQPVLDFARRTLEHCGYTVLAARGPLEALAMPSPDRPVDVLLTDVLMPHLSGPQLVERYLARHPAPRIIYMTGYVDDVTTRLELDEETVLLRKPFGALELARAVRAAVDGPAARPSVHHA